MTCNWQVTVKNWRNLPVSTSKPDLHNINAHKKFGENPLTFTCYYQEIKIWTDISQMNNQCDTIIPCHYPVVGYNKRLSTAQRGNIHLFTTLQGYPIYIAIDKGLQYLDFYKCTLVTFPLLPVMTWRRMVWKKNSQREVTQKTEKGRFFYLGFTALSRIFHLYRDYRSSKVGENRRTRGKNQLTIRKQNLAFPHVTRARLEPQ